MAVMEDILKYRHFEFKVGEHVREGGEKKNLILGLIEALREDRITPEQKNLFSTLEPQAEYIGYLDKIEAYNRKKALEREQRDKFESQELQSLDAPVSTKPRRATTACIKLDSSYVAAAKSGDMTTKEGYTVINVHDHPEIKGTLVVNEKGDLFVANNKDGVIKYEALFTGPDGKTLVTQSELEKLADSGKNLQYTPAPGESQGVDPTVFSKQQRSPGSSPSFP